MDDMVDALNALRWWQDAGVDALVDDDPRDWLRPAAQLSVAFAPARAAPSDPAMPDAPDADAPPVVAPLRAAPSAPATPPAPALPDTLAGHAAWCADPANLPDLGSARVCAAGDPASGVMILCDMPEPGDADAGALMSGDLRRLFDHILAAIGRDRASVYLAAICPARPAGGRIAAGTETALIAAARNHVMLAAPKVLLLMGGQAATAFGLEWPQARGRSHKIYHGDATVTAIATFHPRILPASPACKADMWCDLRLLLEELDR